MNRIGPTPATSNVPQNIPLPKGGPGLSSSGINGSGFDGLTRGNGSRRKGNELHQKYQQRRMEEMRSNGGDGISDPPRNSEGSKKDYTQYTNLFDVSMVEKELDVNGKKTSQTKLGEYLKAKLDAQLTTLGEAKAAVSATGTPEEMHTRLKDALEAMGKEPFSKCLTEEQRKSLEEQKKRLDEAPCPQPDGAYLEETRNVVSKISQDAADTTIGYFEEFLKKEISEQKDRDELRAHFVSQLQELKSLGNPPVQPPGDPVKEFINDVGPELKSYIATLDSAELAALSGKNLDETRANLQEALGAMQKNPYFMDNMSDEAKAQLNDLLQKLNSPSVKQSDVIDAYGFTRNMTKEFAGKVADGIETMIVDARNLNEAQKTQLRGTFKEALARLREIQAGPPNEQPPSFQGAPSNLDNLKSQNLNSENELEELKKQALLNQQLQFLEQMIARMNKLHKALMHAIG
jgi:hypothetical protein